jgi:2-haloacid dehalogenase
MDFSRFSTISFDCYGTLIDWESGILPALRSILEKHGQNLPDAGILELYGEFEAEAESGEYQNYKQVLRSVVRRFADRFHFQARSAEIDSLHDSLPAWSPFQDSIPALDALQKRYKLAVISNIDDDLFAETRKRLHVEFEAVITAEQVRSYKPSLNNFRVALQTLAIAPGQLLHAGQSRYHDVVPARSLGISSVWVNRKSARPGIGAVRTVAEADLKAQPDLEVPDLASLAALAVKR